MDINSLFARAEQAFVGGRLDAARADLLAVGRQAGDHPAVFHLLALVEKKRGDAAAASAAFARASSLAPRDPQISANFANLLVETGEHERALLLYRQALAARPGFADARYNRALLLQRLGRLDEALADLDVCLESDPGARVHSARGTLLMALGRHEEAAAAFDRALQLEPGRATALHGRGRVAMERQEPNASTYYRRALEQKPDDAELVLGLSEALEAEGDPSGLEILSGAVRRHPDWTIGHEVLARMRSEAGEAEDFADHYRASLNARPTDLGLHISHWRSLAKGERHQAALDALREARARLPADRSIDLMEAIFTSEAGDSAAGLRLIDRLGEPGDDAGLGFARARIALRCSDGGQAAALFEQVVRLDPANIGGWAHLDLAWRLIDEPRHQWLSGQPGLFGTADLGLSAAELDDLARLLRTFHKTRAHPIGQSLRGGTQTRGRLFSRTEPPVKRLEQAILSAIRAHFAALPAKDDTHPLLRHRDAAIRITGSWSVRLTSQGFHVNHIHPEGVLSSACYISLPESLGDEATRAGWLELGRPPVELGLDLKPLAVIEPKPGRLALFPSYLFHGTRPFSEGERLTVAFDVGVR